MRKWAQTLADKYLANPNVGPCSRFREGQEFFVDVYEFFLMLNDKFYSETWYWIAKYVYAAPQGGYIMKGWKKDSKVMIACRNDEVRPVIFKIKRIVEE